MSFLEGASRLCSSEEVAIALAWFGTPVLALFRQPILLGELLLLFAILVLGFLHQTGAPLQFFHEDEKPQRRAGLASTLTVAHLFFVLYLVEAGNGLRALPTLVWFVACWLLTVALGVRRCLRAARADTDDAPVLVPPLASIVDSKLGPEAVLVVRPWPFVHGVVLGLLLGAGVVACTLAVLGPLDAALKPLERVMGELGRGSQRGEAGPRPGLHLLAALGFALLVQLAFLRKRLGAAGALCLLLALVASVVGATQFWLNGQLLVLAPAVVLLWWAGRQLYALQLADLAALYGHGRPRQYPPATCTEDPEPLLADQLVSATAAPEEWPSDGLPAKRPLIVVCASGGGLRAAVWTAGVLARLREGVPHFSRLTLLVTGASGGMVGAAYWLASLRRGEPQAPGWQELVGKVRKDSLAQVLQTLTLNDAPSAFSPSPNLDDRGAALQASWLDGDAALDLSVPLVELKAGERERLWPSLVFSPMVVEDGRRLLLGNLRLKSVVESQAPWLSTMAGTGPQNGRASTSAFHAADLFEASAARLTLGTAARLSAAFPYVSPAVVLPTRPRTRVVDAGYYDNFGLDLGTSFLREALEHQRDWLARHVSGILVIRVEDEPSPLSRTSDDPEAPPPLPDDEQSVGARLSRALEGLTSPIFGLLAARNSVMRLRNDAQFETLFQAYERAFGKSFMVSQVFQLKGAVALSWYLTRSELGTMERQLGSPPIGKKVEQVARWVDAGLKGST